MKNSNSQNVKGIAAAFLIAIVGMVLFAAFKNTTELNKSNREIAALQKELKTVKTEYNEYKEVIASGATSEFQHINNDNVSVVYTDEGDGYYSLNIHDKTRGSWLGADYRRTDFAEFEFNDTEKTYDTFRLVNYIE